jgi:transglutaminase-like putative cysteine protease
MVRFARDGKKDPGVRAVACEITSPLRGKDYAAEVYAIFNWVKKNVRYVRDVRDVETLQTPRRTLEQRAGDCDDQAILLSALLESIGHKTRFVALGFKEAPPFEHVVAQTKMGPSWVTLDTTVEYSTVGWYPPNVRRCMLARV